METDTLVLREQKTLRCFPPHLADVIIDREKRTLSK